ncbi:hypothetical protein F5B20DRAFT_587112 [Whalleya microplaca]|nr:hypothetical protein F5B20DRAFT_587112 [Whalleya microplaca]
MSWRSFLLEDFMVKRLLSSPGFHRVVRRIHKTIHDLKHGRDPHEPLRPGEATQEPGSQLNSFLSHFRDEIRNEFRRNTRKPMPPPSSTTKPSKPKTP